ncbi:MAG: TonB-dependent receptor [Thermodesulfobacteriota bacterium]
MKRFILLVVLSMVLFSTPVLLFGQEREVTLEEVVVTATRDVQEVRKIPANVTVLSKEEIERSNSQTVVDLIRDEVGVVVRDYYGTGKNASVDIRGFGETAPLNTLVLVDGRRVNEIDLSGVDWTQIPLDQVERIEIVRGPGTVLYGDNAVGGVINIITKKPEKPFTATGEVVRGSYLYHRESGSISGKWGPLSAILNASYASTEGYRENGLLRAKDFGGKVIYDLSDFISLSFRGGFHKDDAGLPGGLDPVTYKIDRRATLDPNNKSSTEDGYGALGFKAKLWDWGRIETDFSYRHRMVENFFDYPSFFYSYWDDRQLETLGITPKYILERPFWVFKNKLTVGLDFYDSDFEVKAKTVFFGFPSWSHSEISKRSVGLYLLDEFFILPNLILSLGFREEWVTYDILQKNPWSKDKTKEHEPAYSISLNYLFGEKSSAFFSFKRSFRFPVTDELILVFPVFKVNPTMKPQTGYHYEAGIRHSFTDWLEANLTLYWTEFRDEIFFNPVTFANENFPKTRRQGIEVGTKIRPFSWMTFWGNYGYIKPTLREEPFSGNDIPAVPRHKGALGMDIDFGKGFVLNTKMNFVGSRHFVSDWRNQLDRLNGYYTLDSKLSFTWKGFKAFVGINNLFNRKYVEWATTNAAGTAQLYYPSPGRNILGGVSYTF